MGEHAPYIAVNRVMDLAGIRSTYDDLGIRINAAEIKEAEAMLVKIEVRQKAMCGECVTIRKKESDNKSCKTHSTEQASAAKSARNKVTCTYERTDA